MPTDLTPQEEAQLEAIDNDLLQRAGDPQEEEPLTENALESSSLEEAQAPLSPSAPPAQSDQSTPQVAQASGESDVPQKNPPLESPTTAETTKSQDNTPPQSPTAILESPTPAQVEKGQYSAQATLSTPATEITEPPQEATPQPAINKGTCDPNRIYALVQDDAIKDIFRGDALPEYNADQLDVRVLPQGQERLYSVGTPLKEGQLQPLRLEDIKQRQLSFINEDFEEEILRVQNEYIPLEEILTFELQRQEALNLQKGGETPFLDKLASTRGESKEVLASKILKKHEDYMQTLAVLLGNRHKLRNQIERSKDPEEIMKIVYQSPLKA